MNPSRLSIFLACLLCWLATIQTAHAKAKGSSSLALMGGYNLKKPGSAKNIVTAARMQLHFNRYVFLGGEGDLHFINSNKTVVQGKLLLGMKFGSKSVRPYLAINSSYNVIGTKQANGTVLSNFDIGVGGNLGVEFLFGKRSRFGFIIDFNFDAIFLATPKEKFFGGLAGILIQF